MIDTILWDIDGTLLDFDASETFSIRKCVADQGKNVSDEALAIYKRINAESWKQWELGNISKEELYIGRFNKWFREVSIDGVDAVRLNREYQEALGKNPFVREDTFAVLNALKDRYRQYAVTNGSVAVQDTKLALTGLDKIFDGIFISERVGAPKPNVEFFEAVKMNIEDYDAKKTVIIGDSLTSDIKGGNNAGIACIWFNPEGNINDKGLRVDAEVASLSEVLAVVEKM